MNFSYGFIETKGYVAAVEASDAMAKAAAVEVVKWHKTGGALVLIVIRGELGAVRAAIEAASVAAQRVGELVSTHVIANPFEDTESLIRRMLGTKKKRVTPVSTVEEGKRTPAPKAQPKKAKKEKPTPKAKTVRASKSKPKPALKQAATSGPAPKKVDPFSLKEKILQLVRSAENGITLKLLATELNKPEAELRQLLKKLMDRKVLEKVQKKYFISDDGTGS